MSAAARRAFSAPRRPSNRSSTRNLQRSAAQNLFQLGTGAGQKRRLINDFFNVDWAKASLVDWEGNARKAGSKEPLPLITNLLKNDEFMKYYLDTLLR